MIIDRQAFAPHIGTWSIASQRLPDPGVVVLGLHWRDSGEAMMLMMEWHLVEDADSYDPDVVFEVSDEANDEPQLAVWFLAFQDADASDEPPPVPEPMMWAELKWIIPVPIHLCSYSDELRPGFTADSLNNEAEDDE